MTSLAKIGAAPPPTSRIAAHAMPKTAFALVLADGPGDDPAADPMMVLSDDPSLQGGAAAGKDLPGDVDIPLPAPLAAALPVPLSPQIYVPDVAPRTFAAGPITRSPAKDAVLDVRPAAASISPPALDPTEPIDQTMPPAAPVADDPLPPIRQPALAPAPPSPPPSRIAALLAGGPVPVTVLSTDAVRIPRIHTAGPTLQPELQPIKVPPIVIPPLPAGPPVEAAPLPPSINVPDVTTAPAPPAIKTPIVTAAPVPPAINVPLVTAIPVPPAIDIPIVTAAPMPPAINVPLTELAPGAQQPLAITRPAADAAVMAGSDLRQLRPPQPPETTALPTVTAPAAMTPLVTRIAAQAAMVAARGITAIDEARSTAAHDGDPVSALATPAAPVTNIAPAVMAQGGTLDMRQDRWPHAMLDRIEQLRDAANASDTRIRLVPDALGSIDVSVRQEGETLHVHFAAEQAATRTLIQDAQPRLAALAEERGLKLGQSAVDGGAAQQRSPDTPPQSRTMAPRTRTRTSVTTAADAVATGRIA